MISSFRIGFFLCLILLGSAALIAGEDPTRPPWQSQSPTIRKADWSYTGPVNTVYTAANAPGTPNTEQLELVTSLTQYDITWTFDRPVRAGKFITGDWYIVGPVTITSISPKPLFGEDVKSDWKLIDQRSVKESLYEGKWARNGSLLNPPVMHMYKGKLTDVTYIGFDSRLADKHYDSTYFTQLPIAMKPGDSLLSTISAKEPLAAYDGHGQPVLAMAVLTCLSAPVPVDAFRPSYCDREQHVYLARNLHRELLYKLPRPATSPANLSEWARLFQRPWLETVSWGYANPELNQPRYGQRTSRGSSITGMLLHLDYPELEKERLLVHYVQYGIDLWGIVQNPVDKTTGKHPGSARWRGHGGFYGGHKWALIFSGIMLDDAAMRSPNTMYPNVEFGEDSQTAWGASWTGHKVVFTSHPSWAKSPPELVPPSGWEALRAESGNWTRGFQSEGYRRCCTSIEWPAEALAAHLMRAESFWGHDPFFAYVDRWMDEEDIHATAATVLEASKKLASAEDKTNAGDWTLRMSRTDPMQQEMWTTYRKNLPAPLSPTK